MARYVIIGAGAVGASLAAQFALSGIDYVLVGRGDQIAHITQHGLNYRRPEGTRQITLNAFDLSDPQDLTPNDILLLTVKSQDAASALAFWSWRSVSGSKSPASAILPIVTFQNGLSTESVALRTFANVYGASILTPARFTETGTVVVGGVPQPGIVTLGRFPKGHDKDSQQIAADLTSAGYLAEATGDISRWKAAKLLHNVRNVLELFDGPEPLRETLSTAIVEEARLVLSAAGYSFAAPSERTIDISHWRIAPDSGIVPGQQSTWQSFTRGASSEVDFLNGEIVLLGRLHGIASPYNKAVQTLAGVLAQKGAFTEPLPLAAIFSLLDEEDPSQPHLSVGA
ncbi:ketopantoate reductase family protein [Agrobacterium rosae]|uniref:2-dehydropantoate 2-reductase n=1 Tax=Agrobacterium rosae TaxID=1972867 RepID=A0AAW9FLE1_9HYPH|nr:2-dehydropantoate 2-reductase N-terminal domain-containing protein [Agrobacterium rosae]MDX8305258.1 2-dehydropantoate 2-reductase N-terminal domain-containing protein [Agrobacterium rosae]MDX8332544.1 2-dehydropantoate 2-reductase N-terminal domain-containing protein [Agrobacterium rosae]